MQSGEREPPNVPRLQMNPRAAAKHPSLHFGQPIPQCVGGQEPGEGRAGRGWPARRRGLLRGACQPAAGKKRPLPTSFGTALHRRQLQLFFFTSSALVVRVAVFLFHSNRNHPYTSISVNCCTQMLRGYQDALLLKQLALQYFDLITRNLISKMQRIKWYAANSQFSISRSHPQLFQFLRAKDHYQQ